MSKNEMAKIVYELGFKIYKTLGPGLLENAYEACFYYGLLKMGLLGEKQKALP